MAGLRQSGLEVLGDMSWGTHLCHFYETKSDLFDTLIPYFTAGLDDDEYCVWVASDPLTVDDAWAALRAGVPDLDRHIARQSIAIVAPDALYFEGGRFDMQRVAAYWTERLTQALALGYAGLRVAGNTGWLQPRDWKVFCQYEHELNASIVGQRMIVMCGYSLDRAGPAELVDVVHRHQRALLRRNGAWEVVERPMLKTERGIISQAELLRQQRDNTVAALEQSGWKIYGSGGAAEMLGLKPTTLASRLKRFGIHRPN